MNYPNVIAIDPGNELSAFVIWNPVIESVVGKGKVSNSQILHIMRYEWAELAQQNAILAIEMVACYGMAVGKTIFDTCRAVGAFEERWGDFSMIPAQLVYRQQVKLWHCHSNKAKDSNIRMALIDRFGVPGTKKAQGKTYGLSGDTWSAFAIATYVHDQNVKAYQNPALITS